MAEISRSKIKFDPTITLGHILTFFGFLATGFGAWSLMDKRVTVLEVQNVQTQRESSQQREEIRESGRLLRDDMKEVRKSVEEMARSFRSERADRR